MNSSDGFVPIEAIFYAVFHPTEGTKIVHQVPEGSISSIKDRGSSITSLFNFDTVKNYIIPKPQLCNKLISFKIEKYRVLGYPVNIENSDYSRNSFNFNFCFVFPYDSDTTPYESAIERMGKMFRVLEEQNFILSKLERDHSFFKRKENSPMVKNNLFEISFNDDHMMNTPGLYRTQRITLTSIESLIHQIFQDLNNYSECCIPLDSANSVDIKLFPILPPPINIKAFQVPISKVKLHLLVDANWDPTMIKILPYIDGINSVKKISELADADYILTKHCIQHLMHYKCIEVLDIFQFGNIYAPTNFIGDFLKVNGMAEKCQAYIIMGDTNNGLNDLPLLNRDGTSGSPHSSSFGNSVSPFTKPSFLQLNGKTKNTTGKETILIPSKATLFYLYRSLNQGQTVKDWYLLNRKYLTNIDIRRFINFGISNGLIYRVHSYPILNSITRSIEANSSNELDDLIKNFRDRYASSTQKDVEQRNDIHLKGVVNESNLMTGKSKRKVSFKYDVDSKHTILKDIIVESNDEDDEEDEEDGEQHNHDPGAIIIDSNKKQKDRQNSISANVESIAAEPSGDNGRDGSSTFEKEDEIVRLVKLLKGFQHFDSVNTELQKSRSEVEDLIDSLGSYSVINS
ncbi:uncharacterized protein PRCAT00005438001 [Priceomyces carsonii]|uniref:uncharacterized protein n=1 Tax=Priceomyces carsonii TaxID=28549 RepID=UPI002ED9F9C6|nr:unnamed protein product [Priceomyces carsonii]